MKTLANKYSQLIGSFLMELLSLLILNVPLMSIKKQLLIHFAFSYIMVVSFIGGGNRSALGKPPTCRKSLTNIIP
jgi:hypothetical protein